MEPILRWLLVLNVVFLPILVPRGPNNSVPADIPAVLLLVMGTACLLRARQPFHIPLAWSNLLIVGGGLLAVGQSIAPSVALVAVMTDVYLFAWFLVMLNALVIVGDRGLRWAAVAWTAAALGVSALAILASGSSGAHPPRVFGYEIVDQFHRFYGTFRDPNMAGSYLVLSVFVIWASPVPRRRLTKFIVLVPVLIAIVDTKSNAALFALGSGAAVALGLSFVRTWRARAGVVVAGIAIVMAIFAAVPAHVIDAPSEIAQSLGQDEVFNGSLNRYDTSLGLRIRRIDEAFHIFGPDLLLGIGPSTTNDTFAAIGAPITGELHNDYVAAFIERGVIGIIGVISLFVLVGVRALRLLDAEELRRRGWNPAAFTGGVVAVAVTALALETLHFRHVWCLFAMVCAFGYIASSLDRDGEVQT